MAADATGNIIKNFGRNVVFQPQVYFQPRSEEEVLELLDRYRDRRIRVIGRLHAWSDAPRGDDVVIDLRNMHSVRVKGSGENAQAVVEAGCQIKHLLKELSRQGGYTMPSLGLITEQAIAGAASTGTHGSGKHSLAHYLQSLRVAGYDSQSGEAVIRTIDSGPELLAARCALGSLGIATSVTIPVRSQYNVEEHFERYDDLDTVLAAEEEYPLQQFFLVPWSWCFYAQHRREIDQGYSRSRLLYRLYWLLGMDVSLHVAVRLLVRWLPRLFTKLFYRKILPALVPRRWKVVDRSDRQLTMEHEMFRHIEIELFVTRTQLPAALDYVAWLSKHLGGDDATPGEAIEQRLTEAGYWDTLQKLKGSYLHHYPICIRRVLPDDTLISMACGGEEPWYAISLISYADPRRRETFFNFAKIVAETGALLFDARPHWGKYCPLKREQLRRLYPCYDEFCQLRQQADPQGRFQNQWTEQLFGDDPPDA